MWWDYFFLVTESTSARRLTGKIPPTHAASTGSDHSPFHDDHSFFWVRPLPHALPTHFFLSPPETHRLASFTPAALVVREGRKRRNKGKCWILSTAGAGKRKIILNFLTTRVRARQIERGRGFRSETTQQWEDLPGRLEWSLPVTCPFHWESDSSGSRDMDASVPTQVEVEPKERKKIQFAVPSSAPTNLDPRQVEMVSRWLTEWIVKRKRYIWVCGNEEFNAVWRFGRISFRPAQHFKPDVKTVYPSEASSHFIQQVLTLCSYDSSLQLFKTLSFIRSRVWSLGGAVIAPYVLRTPNAI